MSLPGPEPEKHTKPLDGHAVSLDVDRVRRCGYPEVIYAAGKTAAAVQRDCRRVARPRRERALLPACRPIKRTNSATGSRFALQSHRTHLARSIRRKSVNSLATWRSSRPAPATCPWPKKLAKRSTGWACGAPWCTMSASPDPTACQVGSPSSKPPMPWWWSPAWRAPCRAWSAATLASPVIAVPTSVGYGANFGGLVGTAVHAQ